MLDIIIDIVLQWVFLLPNHLIAMTKGQSFELKHVKAKDYWSALPFWIVVGIIIYIFMKFI